METAKLATLTPHRAITAWDEAEAKLRPTDPTTWRMVDLAIDRLLKEVRAEAPSLPACREAAKDLLATIDKQKTV